MKTTILKFFTLSAAIFAFSTISFGQGNTASDDAIVRARIITPITITNTASMEFGNLLETGTEYTVVLGTEGTTIGDIRPTGLAGTIQSAGFDVTGESGATYTITFPDYVILNNGGTGSGNQMTLNNFTSSKTGDTGTLNSGNDSFTVGASLTVNAEQNSGNYTGTFSVTVNYN